ncbi:hypothetical protein M404DRAFT_602122 [Pisolithus tinctorius Marx 270]|uniref:Uncharacterized protein n=1 Tax=Pisolithus tinctorius Marx 270 TaxID=870435 RepID=A0A0C3K3I2_PISTI|nr:hypothetical protein M404DRAFT_602122 [Pisolithus tinctorius Marx 270]
MRVCHRIMPCREVDWHGCGFAIVACIFRCCTILFDMVKSPTIFTPNDDEYGSPWLARRIGPAVGCSWAILRPRSRTALPVPSIPSRLKVLSSSPLPGLPNKLICSVPPDSTYF